ncbi:hypothetical protein FB451DRAFT_1163874 [Mycena latifolia]|nr:hypothetical protein FB451DRAFT_1163874 [Mycena latifolia]
MYKSIGKPGFHSPPVHKPGPIFFPDGLPRGTTSHLQRVASPTADLKGRAIPLTLLPGERAARCNTVAESPPVWSGIKACVGYRHEYEFVSLGASPADGTRLPSSKASFNSYKFTTTCSRAEFEDVVPESDSFADPGLTFSRGLSIMPHGPSALSDSSLDWYPPRGKPNLGWRQPMLCGNGDRTHGTSQITLADYRLGRSVAYEDQGRAFDTNTWKFNSPGSTSFPPL